MTSTISNEREKRIIDSFTEREKREEYFLIFSEIQKIEHKCHTRFTAIISNIRIALNIDAIFEARDRSSA